MRVAGDALAWMLIATWLAAAVASARNRRCRLPQVISDPAALAVRLCLFAALGGAALLADSTWTGVWAVTAAMGAMIAWEAAVQVTAWASRGRAS
jgi:hypothetical protein